jgi:hypothetical protein
MLHKVNRVFDGVKSIVIPVDLCDGYLAVLIGWKAVAIVLDRYHVAVRLFLEAVFDSSPKVASILPDLPYSNVFVLQGHSDVPDSIWGYLSIRID